METPFQGASHNWKKPDSSPTEGSANTLFRSSDFCIGVETRFCDQNCHPESSAADEGSPAMCRPSLQLPGTLAKKGNSSYKSQHRQQLSPTYPGRSFAQKRAQDDRIYSSNFAGQTSCTA